MKRLLAIAILCPLVAQAEIRVDVAAEPARYKPMSFAIARAAMRSIRRNTGVDLRQGRKDQFFPSPTPQTLCGSIESLVGHGVQGPIHLYVYQKLLLYFEGGCGYICGSDPAYRVAMVFSSTSRNKTVAVMAHEMLHVLGASHSTDRRSIMYPYIHSRPQLYPQEIRDQIAWCLSNWS